MDTDASGGSPRSERRKVEEEKKNDAEQYCQTYPLDTVVVKQFNVEGELRDFQGKVDSFDAENGWYKVVYEDGDTEDYDEQELATLIFNPSSKAAPKRRKHSGKKKEEDAASLDSKSLDDDEFSDSLPPKKKKAAKRKMPAKRKQSKTKKKETTPPIESEDDESELSESPPKKKIAKHKHQPSNKTKRKNAASPMETENLDSPPKKSARRSKSPDEMPENQDNSDINMEGPRSRRARRAVSYAEQDEYEFTETDEEASDAKPKKPRTNARGKGAKVGSDDESPSFDESSSSSNEDEFDSESEPESDLESEEEAPRKKKVGRAPAKSAASGEKGRSKPTAKSAADGGAKKKGGAKMCDSFAPINAPLYPKLSLKEIHRTKEFLDPCGMEGTDDIVDRLVGEQVDKLGSLLERALKHKDIGSNSNPLQLGTACSGTDAPALALGLVQEQMELRGIDNVFNFTHEFSCENDPFKQGMPLKLWIANV